MLAIFDAIFSFFLSLSGCFFYRYRLTSKIKVSFIIFLSVVIIMFTRFMFHQYPRFMFCILASISFISLLYRLLSVQAEADHVPTPRSLVSVGNQPTYCQSTANDCSSESRPPNNEPTMEKSDNEPQNFTEVPKVDKPLNSNADSWP